jgi:dUTP pyrophosphatase
MIKVKKLHELAIIPKRNNPTDAGADLYSVQDITIPPQSRGVVSTGISIEIPEGFYGRIAPRSGLAVKNGIDILAGVCDSSYRGEVKVVIINTDKENNFEITYGDKIAQIIIEQHFNFDFIESEELSESNRGENGFGSSGNK